LGARDRRVRYRSQTDLGWKTDLVICPDDGLLVRGSGTETARYLSHGIGHVVAIDNSTATNHGPTPYKYGGDDGVYNAQYNDTDLPDGICDSTVTRPDNGEGPRALPLV
jgi:hypothetical protein